MIVRCSAFMGWTAAGEIPERTILTTRWPEIEYFVGGCLKYDVTTARIEVRERGAPSSTNAAKLPSFPVSRRNGLTSKQKDNLRAALGKGTVARNVDVELHFVS